MYNDYGSKIRVSDRNFLLKRTILIFSLICRIFLPFLTIITDHKESEPKGDDHDDEGHGPLDDLLGDGVEHDAEPKYCY